MKCVLCGQEVSDLERHLKSVYNVTFKNIKTLSSDLNKARKNKTSEKIGCLMEEKRQDELPKPPAIPAR